MNPLPVTDPDRWHRIESILDLALDLSPAERSELLEKSCAGDPTLRAEVEAVLDADAQAGSFLATPAGEYLPDLLAEDEDDLSGQQLGPYRLLREIGGGGMGTVYEAEDTRLGRRVAVKLLPPEYSRDRRAKERFLREARAAAAVDHPNLCTIHDVGESEGRLYLVLSFYEGETLRERIRRGPLPLAEARDIAIQVARGLARAHEAGIVHRDIKPANVMLTRRGEAKILDFGIARLQGDEAIITRTGASWGTPAYMSPEQARGNPVDGRTDVWSLGVMLYEMLSGRRPFGGESLEGVVAAILTREPEPLEDISPELARVAERALAKDPAERYGSAAELLKDLEEGQAPGRHHWRRRARRLSLFAGALILLLGVLLWQPWRSVAGPPLRVAVLKPIVESVGKDPELAFISSDIVTASHTALLTLEGLQPLDPPERNEQEGSETQRLREADEVLLPLLNCLEDSCQVTLSRRKPAGEILKTSVPFEVQGDFENAFQLAEGVWVHVQQIYSDHQLRSDARGATVKPQDYSMYIELQRRLDSGERLGTAEFEQLDSLLQTSPGLVGAYVLATGIARTLGDFDRAIAYAQRAEELAPFDPRPLLARLRAELSGDRLDAALATLARLEGMAPGDVRVKIARADLLEARGEIGKALVLWEEIAQRRPTWRNTLKLAKLEFRQGASGNARRHLAGLMAAQPDNQYVWEQSAAVELSFGDSEHAAALYEELIRRGPAPPYLTANLGFARFLLGDFAAATVAYRQALTLDPDDLLSRFNLATALEAQGEAAESQRIYRALAKELAALPPSMLNDHTRMLHAQCLVRLNQRADAARLADEVLKERPEEIQLLHQAAQIYALLGERNQARFYIELALRKGLQRQWFSIPEFRSLEKDMDFQKLLDRYSPSKSRS